MNIFYLRKIANNNKYIKKHHTLENLLTVVKTFTQE